MNPDELLKFLFALEVMSMPDDAVFDPIVTHVQEGPPKTQGELIREEIERQWGW